MPIVADRPKKTLLLFLNLADNQVNLSNLFNLAINHWALCNHVLPIKMMLHVQFVTTTSLDR